MWLISIEPERPEHDTRTFECPRCQDVTVEVVYGHDEDGHLSSSLYQPMDLDGQESDGAYRYRTRILPQNVGSFVYGVRLLPTHPALLDRYEMGLVRWA